MPARRALLVLVTLALPVLLAGCTADTATKQLDELRSGLDAAREEAAEARAKYEEARARYERVRSLTIVRTERVDLELAPVADGATLTFAPSATRGGVALPTANLTRLPLVAARLVPEPYEGAPASAGEPSFLCEALTCSIRVPAGGAVLLGWEDGPLAWQVAHDGGLRAHRDGAWVDVDADGFGFRDADAAVLATTRVSDATS